MTSPIYEDDELCKRLTEEGVAICGDKFLQIDRIVEDPDLHSFLQYEFLHPLKGAKILDLACGLGETARFWTIEDPTLKFTLNNISTYQLSQCPDFPKVCSNAWETGLPDTEFDYILIQYALGHLPMQETLQECHRMLKPAGKIYIYDLFADTQDNNLDKLFYAPIFLYDLITLSHKLNFLISGVEEVVRKTLDWHRDLGLTRNFMKNTTTYMISLQKRWDL